MKVRSTSPLRLGLAGGGSDVSPYCDQFGGAVLNATISLGAHCTVELTDDDKIVLEATDRQEEFVSPAVERLPYNGTLDLHKGVYNRVVRDLNGGRPLSLKITTFSDAPAGSGLGSSSTMTVAILTALTEALRRPMGEYDLARMSFEIERIDVGLLGGRQDQYAATFGGFNFLEFYRDERVIVNPLRIKRWIVDELELSTVLFYSGASRESASIIAQQIQNVDKGAQASLEATHQLKRDAYEMKEYLLKGDIRNFARCFGRSWIAKRQLAENISNDTIERVLETALAAGAHSGKISGAGGGGFAMLLVDPVRRNDLVRALAKLPGQVVPFKFTSEGAHAWTI